MHDHYCPYCQKDYDCLNDPDWECEWPQYAMCPRCDAAAEESKMQGAEELPR